MPEGKPIGEIHTRDIARFWTKVKGDSRINCWSFDGCLLRGRPAFCMTRPASRLVIASRFMYAIMYGEPGKLFVCHDCPNGDNPLCVNPFHLWLGTPGYNMADLDRKGRVASGLRNGAYTHPECRPRGDSHGLHRNPSLAARGLRNGSHTKPERRRRGTDNGNHKMMPETVLAIRADYAAGLGNQYELGTKYGVSQVWIGKIVNRLVWRHLEDP